MIELVDLARQRLDLIGDFSQSQTDCFWQASVLFVPHDLDQLRYFRRADSGYNAQLRQTPANRVDRRKPLGGDALRGAGLMVENCTYRQPTISTLNRLEVVDTGRRRRWSEEEKARIILESLSRAAPGCGESPAIRLVAFSIGDLAKSLRGDAVQIRGWLVRAVVAERVPAASVAASSESAPAHSTERRIEIELTGRRGSLLMRASTLRRFAGSSRFGIRDDSGSYGSSGLAGGGPHRHA